jgi:hypothetical protein
MTNSHIQILTRAYTMPSLSSVADARLWIPTVSPAYVFTVCLTTNSTVDDYHLLGDDAVWLL